VSPRKSLIILVAFAATSAFACSQKEDADREAASKSCPALPAALAGAPGLPAGFPQPAGVTYTAATAAGPSQRVDGHASTSLTALYSSYTGGLATAPWQVTKKEKDDHDAEVNFAGAGVSGQVKLTDECKGRVSVAITVRPTG